MHKEFFELLHSQHESVKSILGKMSESSETRSRKSLLQQLGSELRPHMQAEEDLFYPIFEQKKQTRDLALEATEEHHVVRLTRDELEALDVSAPNWKAKVLLDMVSHHISEEEGEIFDKVHQEFDEEATDDLHESDPPVLVNLCSYFSPTAADAALPARSPRARFPVISPTQ